MSTLHKIDNVKLDSSVKRYSCPYYHGHATKPIMLSDGGISSAHRNGDKQEFDHH
jgi:hypothetical protein